MTIGFMKEKFTQANDLIHNTFESYEVFLKKVEEEYDNSDYEVGSPIFVKNIFGNVQFDFTEAVKEINIAISKIKKRKREKEQKIEDDKIKNQKWISESARRQQKREESRTGIDSEDLNNN